MRWWWVDDDERVAANHSSHCSFKVVYPLAKEIRLYILRRRQGYQFIYNIAGNGADKENGNDTKTVVENGHIQRSL